MHIIKKRKIPRRGNSSVSFPSRRRNPRKNPENHNEMLLAISFRWIKPENYRPEWKLTVNIKNLFIVVLSFFVVNECLRISLDDITLSFHYDTMPLAPPVITKILLKADWRSKKLSALRIFPKLWSLMTKAKRRRSGTRLKIAAVKNALIKPFTLTPEGGWRKSFLPLIRIFVLY